MADIGNCHFPEGRPPMRQLFLLITLWAWSLSPALALELPGACSVQFVGTSTLHDFSGSGSCEPFVLQVPETPGGEAIVPETVLTVTVAGMETGNASRDEKMYEMFDAAKFPQIAGVLDGGPLLDMRRKLHDAAGGTGSFPLRLRIRGLEAPAVARVTHLVDDSGGLSFDLEFPVSLAAYQLKPPSVLGLIRVGDQVRVKIGLRLAPLPTPYLQ
jgi:hypothetical protein